MPSELGNHEGVLEGVVIHKEENIVRAFAHNGQWCLASNKAFISDGYKGKAVSTLRSHLNIEIIQQLEYLLDED